MWATTCGVAAAAGPAESDDCLHLEERRVATVLPPPVLSEGLQRHGRLGHAPRLEAAHLGEGVDMKHVSRHVLPPEAGVVAVRTLVLLLLEAAVAALLPAIVPDSTLLAGDDAPLRGAIL